MAENTKLVSFAHDIAAIVWAGNEEQARWKIALVTKNEILRYIGLIVNSKLNYRPQIKASADKAMTIVGTLS